MEKDFLQVGNLEPQKRSRFMKNRIVLIALIATLVLALAGCTLEFVTVEPAQDNLIVHFIDVGQGDAILIQQGESNMLIDAGDNRYGEVIVNYLRKHKVKRLDYVIGTHPHADHIGGLDNVINTFEVGKIIMPKVSHNTRTYEDVLLAIKNKGLKITTPKVGDKYQLGEAEFTIIAPSSEKYSNLNDYSVSIRLDFVNNSFIFTGDAEERSEREMLQTGIPLRADVLKVSHHGSSSSTTDEFLKAVNPSVAIIQVGANNRYGHPHREILDKLAHIKVYRTDLHGTIIIKSDGTEITIITEKQ